MFDEIDHRAGWYGGLNWQMAGLGKLSVIRYENQGDPANMRRRTTPPGKPNSGASAPAARSMIWS